MTAASRSELTECMSLHLHRKCSLIHASHKEQTDTFRMHVCICIRHSSVRHSCTPHYGANTYRHGDARRKRHTQTQASQAMKHIRTKTHTHTNAHTCARALTRQTQTHKHTHTHRDTHTHTRARARAGGARHQPLVYQIPRKQHPRQHGKLHNMAWDEADMSCRSIFVRVYMTHMYTYRYA